MKKNHNIVLVKININSKFKLQAIRCLQKILVRNLFEVMTKSTYRAKKKKQWTVSVNCAFFLHCVSSWNEIFHEKTMLLFLVQHYNQTFDTLFDLKWPKLFFGLNSTWLVIWKQTIWGNFIWANMSVQTRLNQMQFF